MEQENHTMHCLSLRSENINDLKLIMLMAQRMGIVIPHGIQERERDSEYQQGLEEGLMQGMEQGLIEGIERGALNKAFELAHNMKSSGFDKRIIMDLTHLIMEDIEEL